MACMHAMWSEGIGFVKEIETPSPKEYISLALSFYNLALWSETKSSFLNSMICIEALYNNSPQELRYRLSHRTANLLGRTENLRRIIFKDMSDFYSKRNKIVHGLKPFEVSNEDRELLLTYSKYSITAFLKLKQKKSRILNEIDEAIYDEERRKQIQEEIKDVLESLEQELKSHKTDFH